MFIKSIGIKNFRCFQNAKFELHKNITVFVGKNGVGKSTILDAISFILGFFYDENIISKKGLISSDDINFSNNDDEITFSSNIGDSLGEYSSEVSYGRDPSDLNEMIHGSTTITDCDFNHIKYLGKYSILAYYSICRNMQYISTKNTKESFELLPNINYKESLDWFDAKDAEEARKVSRGEGDYVDPILASVRSAIPQSLGDMYEFPHMDGTPPELYVKLRGSSRKFKISQLSDGFKAMLTLVMDLARRMAQLKQRTDPNSGLSALNYSGIVLIDEIELHLHPAWQQTVLRSLTKIFPNVQFIVTTHSPQVISSVKPECVRILDGGKAYLPEFGTYGAESSAILEDIFGVPARAHHAGTDKLDKYLGYVNAGKGTTPEALELRRFLDATLSGDPVLALADRTIQQSNLKKHKKS